MSDPLAQLQELDEAPPWSYAAKVLRWGQEPEYLLPDGTRILKVSEAEIRVPYASAHRPRVKGLGGQALMVVISKDPLRMSWGEPQAELRYYSGSRREWSSIDVPLDYPIRTITEEERLIYEHILNNTNGNHVREEMGPRFQGKQSGRGMMEAWGYYFEKFIRVPGGRELIVRAMVSEFPQRADKIERWVDAYKSYYNLGRLPGCSPQVVKLNWVEEVVDPNDPLSKLIMED